VSTPAAIGRFEVVGVLGRGGMGVVYDARDPDLDRPVAIKLILDPDASHSLRLVREAQALAMLQHPNVVAVHEIGHHAGQIYVAMEKVDGQSLDRLAPPPSSWREVLALFVQAGRGLAAAHDKGLIHRDVKPQNLLVDREGRVRVGDFGLVRLGDVMDSFAPRAQSDAPSSAAAAPTPPAVTLTADPSSASIPSLAGATPPRALGAPLTHAASFLGTPRYMAPEQHHRQVATARSDQFSFCVALWEMLFDEHPFEGSTAQGARRRAPRGKAPGWLVAALERGLSVDPERRHPAMASLVELLERTPAFRRRIGLSIAAATIVLVAGGVAVQRIVRERDRAERERAIAQVSRAEAEELVDYMVYDLTEKLEPIGKVDLLAGVAGKTSDYYEGLPATSNPDDLDRRAKAHENIGDVRLAQGDLSASEAEYCESLTISLQQVERTPDDARWLRRFARTQHKLGALAAQRGEHKVALNSISQALVIDERLVARDPTNTDLLGDLAASHEKMGDMVMAIEGDAVAAKRSHEAALAVREQLVATHSDHPDLSRWKRAVSVSHDKIGDILTAQGDSAAALAAFQRSLAIVEEIALTEPAIGEFQQGLAIGHAKVGDALLTTGDPVGALASFEASRAIFARLVAENPGDTGKQRYHGAILSWIGDLHLSQARLPEAMHAYRAYFAIMDKLASRDPSNGGWQRDLAIAHEHIGDVQLRQGNAKDALVSFRVALAIVEKLAAADPNVFNERPVAVDTEKVGDALRALGRHAEAMVEYRRALAIAERLAAQQIDNPEAAHDVATTLRKIGDTLLAQKQPAAALVQYQASLEIVERVAADDPDRAGWAIDREEMRALVATCCRK
jgi:tetratricopeptide (TPR) repeat protein